MIEQWRPVVGFEGVYEVSDQGRVRSVRTGLVRRQGTTPKGYRTVDLKAAGARTTVRVHRLVLFAFAGRPDASEIACHGPGGPSDNRLTNLRWDTPSENSLDVARHGRHPQANRTHCPMRHALTGRNLRPSSLARGRRDCLACARARDVIRAACRQGRGPIPSLSAVADQKYAEITKELVSC